MIEAMTDRGGSRPIEILGPLEQRVMAELWRHGAGQSVGEVLEALNVGTSRALAYTTVMTILVRLHGKGYLTREKKGRHFRYEAVFDERALQAQVGRRELSRLIDRYGVDTIAEFAVDLGEGDLARRLADVASDRDSEP